MKAKGIIVGLATLAIASCASTPPYGQKWYELNRMADPVLDQVFLFYLGEAWTGMTDINECLQTASRVKKDDPDSWTREWRKTAERLNATADQLVQEGHTNSAGQYYLRAASYYRAALHRHMHPGAPDVKELADREVACFTLSQKLLGAPMEVVQVPYEGVELTGYFYVSPRTAGAPAPTLIVHQGRDAWAEDCKYIADEAMRRGYNCLLLDGPGNGQALRRHDLPFRPDWEAFITPTVDFLLHRPEVDPTGIMEMGMSMGGYLAGRAAAKEHRLRAIIANPGVLDWGAVFFDQIKGYSPQMLSMYKSNPKALNSLITVAGRLSPFLLWGVTDTMWKHGVKTPVELMDTMKEYTNVEGAKDITATTLVIDGEAEEYGQARQFYDALTCPKDYLFFTEAEAAPLHVQTGALAVSSQRIFDWIDDTVGPGRVAAGHSGAKGAARCAEIRQRHGRVSAPVGQVDLGRSALYARSDIHANDADRRSLAPSLTHRGVPVHRPSRRRAVRRQSPGPAAPRGPARAGRASSAPESTLRERGGSGSSWRRRTRCPGCRRTRSSRRCSWKRASSRLIAPPTTADRTSSPGRCTWRFAPMAERTSFALPIIQRHPAPTGPSPTSSTRSGS